MKLLMATSNKKKLEEIQQVLGLEVEMVNIDLPEIQAVDVRAVIEDKARRAFDAVKQPVLVEDTSLAFQAWNGLPGALIKWFLKSLDNEGMTKMLSNFTDRTANAEVSIGLFDGSKFEMFSGAVQGIIATEPRGTNGFGWDAIFIPDGSEKTFAEMSNDEKLMFSMRKVAVLKLQEYLRNKI